MFQNGIGGAVTCAPLPTINFTQFGIDLAKVIFQVHGIDARGKGLLYKQLKRTQVIPFFAKLPPRLIGMESCGGANFWARQLMEFWHTVKLMAPQLVKPYVKTNKNDAANAEAICEAVGRPNMRLVPIKNTEQQALLGLHRAQIARDPSKMARTTYRGGPCTVARLFERFRTLAVLMRELEREINAWHREDAASLRLQAIPGIGPLTASGLVASVADARAFHNGRQFAAWLGLVARQSSSGGKHSLLGISKRGDTYLRTLLIHARDRGFQRDCRGPLIDAVQLIAAQFFGRGRIRWTT